MAASAASERVSLPESPADEAGAVAAALAGADTSRSFAKTLVEADSLKALRGEFHFPPTEPGCKIRSAEAPSVYLCGNSLGLQPKAVEAELLGELEKWKQYGVEGHFKPEQPWVTVEETVHEASARLVGAKPLEVAVMNSLTTNLHLLMVPFYRPTATRHKIIIEGKSFPSDYYAVESQIKFHGFDPATSLVEIMPSTGASSEAAGKAAETLTTQHIIDTINEHGDSVALVMISGVQYYTGQAFDLGAIAAAAKAVGATVGFDCAHAVGNVPLHLHDWGVDFAVWCTYKYLNSGPGNIGGAFVHEVHALDTDRPRFAGWWGHNKSDRFDMHHSFNPTPGAFGFQLSNPPVLCCASLRASLRLFDRAGGVPALRAKSIVLTGYLEWLLQNDPILADEVDILTPSSPGDRGAQLSLVFKRPVKEVASALSAESVIVDTREPFAMRVAPAPLYNNALDVWEFATTLRTVLEGLRGETAQ